MSKVFIIDDDELFADCIARGVHRAWRYTDSHASNTDQSSHSIVPPAKNIDQLAANTANTEHTIEHYKNAIDAINSLSDPLPALIFLDILLPGPDGFTFLNELVSYPDTAQIPVVLVTSLNLPKDNLQEYGVVGILNKETMKPSDVEKYAERYTH